MGDLFSTVINGWVRNPGEVGDPTDEENVALQRDHGQNSDNIGYTDQDEIATGTGDEDLHPQEYDEQYGQYIPEKCLMKKELPYPSDQKVVN